MAYEGDSIFWVEVEKVVPNPFQPRREFNEEKLKELAESIRMYGVLQPLVVTRKEIIGDNGAFTTQYELIAGERRLRASKLGGLLQVPVIIRSEEENEQMKFELAIIENLQREDLNAVDRALAFKQLAEQFELSHAQVAKKMGRSREYVSNSIRLLQLPEAILNALRVGDISDGHARTLLMLNDRHEEQDTLFREILLKKLSVREVERIARKIATDKVRKKDWGVDPEIIEIEKKFTSTLGTRVQIIKTDYGGKLTIDYFSQDDLEKLLELVNHEDSNILMHGNMGTESDEGKTVITKLAAATPLVATEILSDTPHVTPAPEKPSAAPVVEEASEPATNISPEPVAPVSDVHSVPQTDSVHAHVEKEDVYQAPQHEVVTEVAPEVSTPNPTPDPVHGYASAVPEPQNHFPLTDVETLRAQIHEESAVTEEQETAPAMSVVENAVVESVEPAVPDSVQAPTPKVAEPEKSNEEEDTDLYSLKNFSL